MNEYISVEAVYPPYRTGTRVLAEVDLRVGLILVRGVKLIAGIRGQFLGFPSRKVGPDEYQPVVDLGRTLAEAALPIVQQAVAAAGIER